MAHSLIYPKKLTQSVGNAVIILESMLLEVCHLDLVEMYDTDAINPLNAELNPICHLLALLGGATIVVVSRLRVKESSDADRMGLG